MRISEWSRISGFPEEKSKWEMYGAFEQGIASQLAGTKRFLRKPQGERNTALILVTGGSGSGKSAYAECVAVEKAKNGEALYYLATMEAYDGEGRRKIARHRRQRRGKGFCTIEQPVSVGRAADRISSASGKGNSVVLLECLSNLVANEMFQEQIQTAEAVSSKVLADIALLNETAGELVLVTAQVSEDGICYEETTMSYIKALGEVNAALARMAESVVEVVAGIPLAVKGNLLGLPESRRDDQGGKERL